VYCECAATGERAREEQPASSHSVFTLVASIRAAPPFCRRIGAQFFGELTKIMRWGTKNYLLLQPHNGYVAHK
jgi:hypothetical protein